MIGSAGRNLELAVSGRHGEDAAGRGLFRKDQTDAAAVRARFAIGRVVDLQNDVGAGLDELGLPRFEFFGRLAGGVADQEIAWELGGIDVLIGLGLFGNEWDAG